MEMFGFKSLIVAVLLIVLPCVSANYYEEELMLTPLPNGHLHTNFNFNITSAKFPVISKDESSIISNFNVFPNSLINLITQTSARNLSIRLTSGYWNSESWGKLPRNGYTSGGNGLEIWASIEASSKDEAFERWRFLVNSLSGFFCASLNFIDETITTFPERSFSEIVPSNGSTSYLLRAALPREPICTENLTPIIKLLPTKGRAGISSVLDSHKVFDSKWVSTSIDISSYNVDTSSVYYTLDINLNNVVHIPTSLNKLRNPLPKPIPGEELNCDYDKFYDMYHCFPSNDYINELHFNLEKIYGRKAKLDRFIGKSRICANVKKEDGWELKGTLSSTDYNTGHFLYVNTDLDDHNCFVLKNNPAKIEDFDIDFKLQKPYTEISADDKPDIFVTRSITGYELDKGGFRVVFRNPTDHDVNLVFFESLPWYLRIYLHTLTINHKSANISQPSLTFTNDHIIKDISYLTAIDRQRPTKLELTLSIPKNSVITLTYSFDKSLLLYSEYPPDANHGFELEPAVITLLDSFNKPYYILRTATLLVSLPTPDFSMPYNVIILTSTIMALVFGTVFNLLVKRIISEDDYEKLVSTLPKKNLKFFVNKIKSKFFKP